MKLVGITGSCGKTSVAEIVYQYLIHKGYATSLYSSNGLFVNGLTREKDFLQTTLYHKDLNHFLKEDEENLVEYAIIEITAESVKRNDLVYLLHYDIVAMTNFFSNLHNHFEDKEDYYNCKRKILSSPYAKKVLLRLEDPSYSMFSDLPHITYGYNESVKHRMIVNSNTINGLELKYNGELFRTNLITAYHARNMACALAILAELNVLDMTSFSGFAKNVFIRGRFEKLEFKRKNIIIDTGYAGMDILLNGLETTIGNNNYKIIYSNIHYTTITDWVIRARKRVGEQLVRSKFVYLTSPTSSQLEEEIFLNYCNINGEVKYKYIPNTEEACITAVNELNENETLIIITREHYRSYRNLFERLVYNN